MGNLLSKTAGAVMGAVVAVPSVVAAAPVIKKMDTGFADTIGDYNAVGTRPGGSFLTNAFGALCKDGHLNPEVPKILQERPDIAAPISKGMVEIMDGTKSLPLDEAKMPYTAGVVNQFMGKLNKLLNENEGFKSYVDQMKAQPDADPYIRANLVTGALEFGCRQHGQISGLVEDTFNAVDKNAIRDEMTPILNDAIQSNKLNLNLGVPAFGK
jgi:hypothetical protein